MPNGAFKKKVFGKEKIVGAAVVAGLGGMVELVSDIKPAADLPDTVNCFVQPQNPIWIGAGNPVFYLMMKSAYLAKKWRRPFIDIHICADEVSSQPGVEVTGKQDAFKGLRFKKDFTKAFGVEDSEMFDPKSGSPVYALPSDIKSSVSRDWARKTIDWNKIKMIQAINSANGIIESSKNGVMLLSLQTGNAAPLNNPASEWKCGSYQFIVKNLKNENDIISDVIQGASPNCYFMGALFSKAWCSYPTFPPSPGSPDYNITFYNQVQVTSNPDTFKTNPNPITVKCGLLYDTVGNMVCAQLTPQNEIWPVIYEKAYAKFRGLPDSIVANNPQSSDQGSQPDIRAFGLGSPLDSLYHITALKFDFGRNTTASPTAFETQTLPLWSACNPPSQTSYNELFYRNSKSGGNYDSKKTMYPTVAWTYESIEENLYNHVDNDNTNPLKNPVPCSYDNSTIARRHTYSLLGLVTSNGTNYIVLRNPWGINYCSLTPPITGVIQNSSANPVIYQPSANVYISLYAGRNDGIFAIKSEEFDHWFQGFGWNSLR